jgi:hypothetical protein
MTNLIERAKMRRFGLIWILAILCTSPLLADKVGYLGADGQWHKIESKDWPAPPANAHRERLQTRSVSWNITYLDTSTGFYDSTNGATRRATLNSVLSYISTTLNATGSADVEVRASESDASGFLAFAGTYYPVADGFYGGSTVSHITTGTDPFVGTPDIYVTVDFGYNWNSGTGAPTVTQYDLYSVLLHEITHGLGLVTLSSSTGASQFSPDNTFTKWDEKIMRQSTSVILWSGSPPAFNGTAADLTSNNLRFTGSLATSAYSTQGGSGSPPVYAPASFAQGSSLGHWDLGLTGGGVMQPSIGAGVQRRTYTAIDIGALRDIGYTNAAGIVDWSVF